MLLNNTFRKKKAKLDTLDVAVMADTCRCRESGFVPWEVTVFHSWGRMNEICIIECIL